MRRKNWIILALIVLIGAFFRFYRLGTIPEGFFSDEAAVGYNAYSLVKTGKDEFGKPWPLFFTSFGEGKLPLYVYQAVPTVWLLGPTELAVRLPGAFFGTLTVLVWFFLLQELLRLSLVKERWRVPIGLTSTLVLAVMPWHIHFSRGVFGQESVFWVVLGSWLVLKGLRVNKQAWVYLGFLGLSASLMVYHAPKVVLPFWVPALLSLVWLTGQQSLKDLAKKTVLGVLGLTLVWGLMSFSGAGIQRSKGISVFSVYSGVFSILHETIEEEARFNRPTWYTRLLHNKVESYGREIAGRYLAHFNPDFLFVSGDKMRPRYRVPGVAQIYLVLLPFALIGIYFLVQRRSWLLLILLALAPLPAALTFETPSTVRALLMTVPLSGIIGSGLVVSFRFLKPWRRMFLGGLIVLAVAWLYQVWYFYNSYFFLAQIHQSYEWQGAYERLVKRVANLEDDYQRVVSGATGGPPYIFFLFYNRYDPVKYQAQVNQHIGPTDPFGFIHITGFGKYEFVKVPCPFDPAAADTLFICEGEPDEQYQSFVFETVYHTDRTPAFTLLDTKHED
jgi:4-amino-4-deoxy-L-arabinose transferase-like glycosyltransferase